jgi:phage tail sheath gpL-like
MALSTAFQSSRVASGLAIKTSYEQPQRNEPLGRPIQIFVIGVAESSKSVAYEPVEMTTLAAAATHVGYRSTIYEALKALKPAFGSGVGSLPITYFPLEVTTGGAAAGDITPSGTCASTQIYTVKINNIASLDITMLATETVADFITKAIAAINGVLDMPMTAADGTTTVDLTAGFHTNAGDHLYIEIDSPADADMTFSITQPTGGSGTVDYSDAWAAFNDTWYSHVLFAQGDATNSTFLDSADTFGESQWAAEVYKPFKCYTGSNESTAATIRAITDARKSDRTNSIKWVPGGNDIPWVIAGRMLATQLPVAASDPAMDYIGLRVTGLKAGPVSVTPDSGGRDAAVKDGLSTITTDPPTASNTNGTVYIEDSVMCYHPDGEEPPGYRWDVDLEKDNYMTYNLSLIYSERGNPLVPDGQAVKNSNARKPSYYKRKTFALYDGAAMAAVISDPQYAKDNTQVGISGSNPRRLDADCVYKIAGNVGVRSVDKRFSLYVGGES